MKKVIAIGNDHGGVELKNAIMKHYKNKYEFINVGTDTTDSVDYPVYAIKVGELVASGKAAFGVVICKSGIGVNIAANKVKGVRCAHIMTVKNAHLCKAHNNANVMAFGVNDVSPRLAYKCIDEYDNTVFEERHQKRIDLISKYEQ